MRTPARRRLATISAAVIAVVGFSVTSATASDPSEACNPTGRAICITTSDVDGITHSTTAVARSTVYSVSVRNGGGSALTNVSATLKLVDVVGGVDGPSSGSFVAATLPSFCTLTTPRRPGVRSRTSAQAEGANLGSFAARTSKNLAAAVMRLDVTVTAKERGQRPGRPARSERRHVHKGRADEPRGDRRPLRVDGLQRRLDRARHETSTASRPASSSFAYRPASPASSSRPWRSSTPATSATSARHWWRASDSRFAFPPPGSSLLRTLPSSSRRSS